MNLLSRFSVAVTLCSMLIAVQIAAFAQSSARSSLAPLDLNGRRTLIANAAEQRTTHHPSASTDVVTPVYLVLAGGVSLGAYEGGYASTIARYLKAHPDRYQLRGISGTSAGSLNAIATALEYCRLDSSASERTTVPFDVWAPISWSMLYDPDKITRSALLHHEGLRVHGMEILRPDRYPIREDCDVTIIAAVTQNYAGVPSNDLTTIGTLIEYLGVRLRGTRNHHARYEALAPDFTSAPQRLSLPATTSGEVSPQTVLTMLMASSAFPSAFPPVAMQPCMASAESPDKCVEYVKRTYIDGGVFHNVPVTALLPAIAQETTPPLILLIDLDNAAIAELTGRENTPGMGALAQTWLSFARARDYATAYKALEESPGYRPLRAQQRLPLASEHISAFAGFLDRTFREVDHALGVHDALLDLETIIDPPPESSSEGVSDSEDHRPPVRIAIHPDDQCIHDVLQGASISEKCAQRVPLNNWVTLRAIVATAEKRCELLPQVTEGCTALSRQNLRERLPHSPLSAGEERQRRSLAGQASAPDYQAFLEELRLGDFHPELSSDWTTRRGANRIRPEAIWSRALEDALRRYAAIQQPPVLPVQIAVETLLSSNIPILPRPSFTLLANLQGLEVTGNIPLSTRIHLSVGASSEWGARATRAHRLHLFSGGPAIRLGWQFSEKQALVAFLADVHAGVLFGPALPEVAADGKAPAISRDATRPNAAIYVGMAPKLILFRRVTADIPLRLYWLCENAGCTRYDSPAPSFAISIRIGWTWTLASER